MRCGAGRRPFCKKAWRKTCRRRCGGDNHRARQKISGQTMSPRKIPAHVGSEKPLSMARVLQRRWLACAAASDAGATLLSGRRRNRQEKRVRRRVAGNKSASAATTGRVADARGGTGTGTTAQRGGRQRLHDAKEGAEPMQVRVQKQAANRRNKRGMICRHVRPPQIQTVYCMLPFRYFPGKTKAAPARIPGWGPLFSLSSFGEMLVYSQPRRLRPAF